MLMVDALNPGLMSNREMALNGLSGQKPMFNNINRRDTTRSDSEDN